MEKMGLNDIRKEFLDFFSQKDHFVHPSFSLVPENDKSLLLINSGMAPLKPYFMGLEKPPKRRMATCQKCIRTGDIENVGKTARHGTFFEMLGNFSFGDYFKNESIQWGWEFVTQRLKMPIENLWVTVYEQDDEAFDIWNKKIGIPQERIVRLGKGDNFWEIGLGPCGPCSEIYFDRGEKHGCGHIDCKPGCECDRYVEFWNHVFTQFDKDENGNYNPLPKPNIDTGMGLERVACIMQEVDSIFDIDTMQHILSGVVTLSGVEYGANSKSDISIRIITDHIRSVTFMVSDGIMPSNEGRGYVLRRLLRRAAKHGKQLGIHGAFLTQLVDRVITVSGSAYPELTEKQEYIKKVIAIEEERFRETIDQGSEILKTFIEDLKKNNLSQLSGEHAFKLYDTYGFPLELTMEILEEEDMTADEAGFKEEMEKQRTRARSARHNSEEEGWKEDLFAKLGSEIRSSFEGYERTEMDGKILAIMKDGHPVEKAYQNDEVILILDATPFYPEGGGQVGDRGILKNEAVQVQITDCKKGNNERILHYGKVLEGILGVDSAIKASVDIELRRATERNHTATHLLHKALKEILGEHVEQAGSLVTPERLRFDFTHFQALTQNELSTIEEAINKVILAGLTVQADHMPIEEAKRAGATALFGEKYGSTVRVVSIGDYSIELCGGTHIDNIAKIGLFKLIGEGGVAAGIRRIEAATGLKAYEHTKEKEKRLLDICSILKTNEKEILTKTEGLVQELKASQKEIEALKNKLAGSAIDDILEHAVTIQGVKTVVYSIEGLDMESLRSLTDKLKDKIGSGLVVLGSPEQDKVNFVAMATEDVVKKGVHAGNIIKEVAKTAGGGGGGRPNMAQAGGKDISKLQEALKKVEDLVRQQVNG
ncbi:MAG: alanine--tRNA ligase [Thermotaleaceae bacterium]